MKKPFSLGLQLVFSTTIAFILFISTIVVTAFSLYSQNVTSLVNEQITSSNREIISNYETYFSSVIGISNKIQIKIDNINVDDHKSTLISYFDDILSFKTEVIDIGIYSDEGLQLVSDSKSSSSIYIGNENWFSLAKQNPLINVFSSVKYVDNQYAFTISKVVKYNNNKNKAILKFTCDFTNILNLISNSDFGEGGHVTIYDKKYELVYTSSETEDENEKEVAKEIVIGETDYTKNNKTYLLYAATLTDTTWRVTILTNKDVVGSVISTFVTIISACAVIISFIFFFVLMLISKNISSPIKKLQKEMLKVENLNYDVSITDKIGGSSEVRELSSSFNLMMQRIKDLTNGILKEKEEQRKSELKALQNQINPHFLYNTLDSIIFSIDKNELDKAEKMIVALSKFFRISISRGKNIISLKDEVEHVRNYLLIQKLRFGEKFQYDITLEKDLESFEVIKLILQPIVENAIVHSFDENEGIGNISINAYKNNSFVNIDIIDNGYGMTEQKVIDIYASFKDDSVHNGVGLKNVYQRLKIYYGETADIIIKSVLDEGTIIQLIIPLKGVLKNEE